MNTFVPPLLKMIDPLHHEYPPMLGPLEAVPEGSPEWAERLGLRIKHGVERIEDQGIERLIPLIEMALDANPPPWKIWPSERPCHTPDGYFRYAAHIGCASLSKLVAAYKADNRRPSQTDDIPPKRIDRLVRRLQAATGQGQHKIADQNILRGKADPHNDVMRVGRQGNAASYLLRRLSRERPDILAAYEGGDYANPTAAARAAGFKVDTPPLTKLRRAWKRATAEERAAFRAEIADA